MTVSFASAWLSGEPRALALLPDRFRHAAARRAAAEAAARPVAPALLEALAAQNARLAPSAGRQRHLDRLATPGTTAVVTGQQVGLFLGPLYTVYKAAAAVAAARALEAETGRPCVPVFWLQTEDHDLPEIDHCFVPRGTGESLRLSLDLPATSRVPVAHVRPDYAAALEALRAEVAGHPHGEALLALLAEAYRPGASLAEAFARTLAALFDDLVFVDPRDPALAPLAAPVHRRALDEAPAIAATLAARSAALEAAGFRPQVHVRPGAPLSFFAPDADDGPRYRLDPAGPDAWSLVGHPDGATVGTAELRAALERAPQRFTTSALLRPLLQDTWLPTAAYVGGPGEVTYFAQLPPLYAHFGLPLPLVVPRARFRVLDDRTRGLLDKLNLTPDDAAAPRDALLARLARAASDADGLETPETIERRLVDALTPELARLREAMSALDPNLARTVQRTEESLRDQIARLVARYGRALAQRDQVTVERLDRLRAFLLPEGAPQERVHGLPYYAARFGARELARLVLATCVPFDGALRDLTP